ncbi:transcription initiation factor TFIID subunit 1 isoform X2 [Magnolia sinica]|uniref:transcription initiation factor TFIID subunit 1 isoform X2 n=1 Tax=Magnolia sinica TaxID=86752 RepID=UPI00265832E5|nr:transcription initiation factor TFIID subunit 1 isoform X2 [Magnolia sinica]XP_058086196.1 transcription initiation factor TFIID subunit 1 isoform X2 [Magnolia sinica]
MKEVDSVSQDVRDEDDEDDYEEVGGGNRLLGFMFGNVDGSGDLDVDYLDEDAKEHIAALADKLGPSLTEINLSIKLPHTPGDASEQDYDLKAEDAVDYEDIDEQYEGPEIQAASEEDHLLPKQEYFSTQVSLASLGHQTSVFDDENYDDDEEFAKEHEVVENNSEAQIICSAGLAIQCTSEEHLVLSFVKEKSPDEDMPSLGTFEVENAFVDLGDFQEEEPQVLEEQSDGKKGTPLPVLCIEDGMVVLRFSEIFGVHEPLKKREKRDHHRYSILRERYKTLDASDVVEEDEEAFLKGSFQGALMPKPSTSAQDDYVSVKDGDVDQSTFGVWEGAGMFPMQVDEQRKDSYLCAQPMKEGTEADLSVGWQSPSCPKFYPLDQQDWEEGIIWGNSPPASHESSESCVISGSEPEAFTNSEIEVEAGQRNLEELHMEPDEKDHSLFLRSCPVLLEPFGSRKFSELSDLPSSDRGYHPQILRLESRSSVDDSHYSEERKENGNEELCRGDAMRRLSKLSLRNKELLEGSWLDKIIWESSESVPRPKLILDLQDEQMLFEILDNKDGRHLRSHAGAMIITRSTKSGPGVPLDPPGQGGPSVGRFNISNDKYYSNRKTSQQSKSHLKKRAVHGVKIMHSVPALRLQTMKPKLSNKDIANFHRPKALWYPHDNEVAAKEQGKLSTQGPMKIILKSMGGKGSKLHVDAEETVSSVKAKASKKMDFRPSEKVKVFYSGKELEDDKSLAMQNVRPNSILHLVRTKIQLWPKAQKLPGENKPLRPPGAFKKKSELSAKDGHVFLMEYSEERPLLLGNIGMGARLCTYYQKSAPGDQTASSLRNGSNCLGNVLTLDPADKSPFLGDIKPGCSQSCLETNMYRAPIFPHKLASTDYLLVRSAKGRLSLRRIDKIHVVGQQEPHMEVISPGSKGLQTYIGNRLLVYLYREFRANEKPGLLPYVRADELSALFPNLSEAFLRKRLKHCADLQRGPNGQLLWFMRRSFRIPSEEELRRMVTPEDVCAYESMQAGLYRLKRLGISRLTHPVGLSSAMNQLPDEAIALAAASHIERELQITSWNLSSNFVACTNQDRENIERLEITGVGDPSGRGLGFSYVRVAPKAPVSGAVMKKKATANRGGTSVTGTDADLRRLSMDAAREVLLKFNVPEEQIEKMTRWHRIAMVRKLSSEQAASGVMVDAATLNKFARGQRMSFLQLQQQTREKCQEIWDRQVLSLSAADGDENETDSEANSDLDSFAGDLENLLDAEECEDGEEGKYESKHDKADGVRGLKMRRRPSQAQAVEEIEDEAAEAAELCRMLMDDDEAEGIKKKKMKPVGKELGFGSVNADCTKKTKTIVKKVIRTSLSNGSFIDDPKEVTLLLVENFLAKRNLSGKIQAKKGIGKIDVHLGLLKKKSKAVGDGFKVIKEKKQTDKPVRESFVCGACGQLGHMRTNKNCPKYGEDPAESQVENMETESISGKAHPADASTQPQPKPPIKKLVPKGLTKMSLVEVSESVEKSGSKLQAKIVPLKLKCGSTDKLPEKIVLGPQTSDKQIVADTETGSKSLTKINKIIISSKLKSEDVPPEPQKPPSVVIRPPVAIDRDQPRKKIIIKQPKVINNVEQASIGSGVDEDFRRTKKITELSSFETHRKPDANFLVEEAANRKAFESRRWEEEEKRRKKQMMREEKARRLYEEERQLQEEQLRMTEMRRREEVMRKEREERQKAKKKKKKKPDFRDEYLDERTMYRNDRKKPDRDRAAKRRPAADLGRYAASFAPQTKRRKGGEVVLSNILEGIVKNLKDRTSVSYLFLKPVLKKDAPDYLDIIEHPMDLSTITDKVRKMDYKNREEFRHDVAQITINAHKYNDQRNPSIPPLADQLLELCDYMLEENADHLDEAESGIEIRDF